MKISNKALGALLALAAVGAYLGFWLHIISR